MKIDEANYTKNLEVLISNIAKKLKCLPDYSDPVNGNAHIFNAIEKLTEPADDCPRCKGHVGVPGDMQCPACGGTCTKPEVSVAVVLSELSSMIMEDKRQFEFSGMNTNGHYRCQMFIQELRKKYSGKGLGDEYSFRRNKKLDHLECG